MKMKMKKKKARSGNNPPKKRVVKKEGMRELGPDELGRVQGGRKKKAPPKKKKGSKATGIANACANANDPAKLPFDCS